MRYAAVSGFFGFRVMVLGYFSRESRRMNLSDGRTTLRESEKNLFKK